MAFGMSGFVGRLRALGRAWSELVQAELGALQSDLRVSATTLRAGAVAFAIAGFFAFWTVGGLTWALVEILAFWLPRWGAVLSATGLFALFALTFGLIGRAQLRKLESPARTVAKRVESHSQWVKQTLLGDPDSEPPRDGEG